MTVRYQAVADGSIAPQIIGALFDAASMAKSEKARAHAAADKLKVDRDILGLRKGEFFREALKYQMTPGFVRRRNFSSKFKYPDYFNRGQSTPFASPINPQPTASSGGPRGGGGIDPDIVPNDAILGNMINITPGGLSKNVQSKTPMVGSSGTRRYESSVSEKNNPVEVKDEKLGIFFAAIAESLNRTVASINQKQGTLESQITAANQSNLAIAKGLEVSNDTIGDKLDAIAGILNEQLALAKLQADQSETKEVKKELKKEDDKSGTERFTDLDEDPNQIRKENELENALDVDNDELDFGGVDVPNFEQGGIVSGPDSGYLVRLHGDEMITPLDNNYTQGQPSAVDGVTRKQYETGTDIPAPTPQIPAMNFFSQRPSETSGNIMKSPVNDVKRDKFSEENLMKAMKLPFEVASLGIMAATGNAVRATPGFSGMKHTIGSVIDPVAQAFSVKDTISGKVNNLLETKAYQSEQRNQDIFRREQSENRRAWWDIFGLFRGNEKQNTGDGGIGGIGGPGLSGASSLQNLFHGTSNARASSIMSSGFRPSNAMSWAGRGKTFLTPDFWNSAQYARPGATGLNPFSVKGLPNTGFGNMMSNRGQVLNVLQPKGSGLRLPGWLKRLGISPEVAVNPNKATKGMNLANRLMGGKYPNSPTANAVRGLMTSPANRGMGLMGKLSPLLKGGIKLGSKGLSIASFLTDFIFPDAVGQYQDMHGPNAYYNHPGYTGERPSWAEPLASNKAEIVDMTSKEQSLNKLIKNRIDPDSITLNSENVITTNTPRHDEPMSHIDNSAETQVDEYQFVYSAYK